MAVIFPEKALASYFDWQINDKKVAKKINELIKDILRNGLLEGIGQPEKLKYRPEYSRRIDQEHRLIYSLDENDDLVIHSCKGHYED
jgi:toxin YoeB